MTINYQNAKIYKLINTITKEIYIGSTTRPLNIRLNEHKSVYTTRKNNNTSYNLFNETDEVIIELIENVNCKTKKELLEREQYYIKNIDCINLQIPLRTIIDYTKDKKEEKKEYDKKYREENKERCKEQSKKYREENKERLIGLFKLYYEEKKEEYKKKSNHYYHKNKGKLLEKITCECGCIVSKVGLTKHKKTKKHINLMELKGK